MKMVYNMNSSNILYFSDLLLTFNTPNISLRDQMFSIRGTVYHGETGSLFHIYKQCLDVAPV